MQHSKSDMDRLKGRHALSAIIGRRVKLRKAGHELVGLCPFHDENTPSFRVNDAKGVFHCFGCSASGDVIDWLREAEGMSFADAISALADVTDLPTVDPRDRARQARTERADRAAAILAAQAQWHDARPIRGTPAEIYLREVRGIKGEIPGSIRFARVAAWKNQKTGADGPRLPAVIAAGQNGNGKVMGVQRIFLTKEGQKARMTNPKLSLGQVRGCALRLGPVARHIILCEGPEDGLTLCQRHPGTTIISPGASVWVSFGTGALPFVELPDAVQRVTIAGDNNEPGRLAVRTAMEAFAEQGRQVDAIYPPPAFADWNDELMAVLA